MSTVRHDVLAGRRPRPGVVRPSWRDTVRLAADVALLGIVTTAAALPVVTAGAAAAAGSAAMHHFLEYDRWPTPAASWRVFRRSLLPGLAGTAGALLLVLNLLALHRGVVPGGRVLTALTATLMVVAAGYAGLLLAAFGSAPHRGWRAALRQTAAARPAAVAATAGVILVAVVLAVLVHPALMPVLAGCALFALHGMARRGLGVTRRTRSPIRG
ncbi:hypothetical protein [Jidongwangia harbinensis]|uniref:hypothetical protein n=1 Tax=Jidongwangia harbinensis TaxID=2878561 RepID=UPI001CD9DF47|nr:hypothetical protein [Jidongwangia harbinensis]MCA2213115.1 hypothetical protein [Jidongwangia harbinensis]